MNAGGTGSDRCVADGVAPFVAEAASHVDLAEKTIAHLLHGVLQRRRGAALAALLYDAIVFARRRDNLLRLEHIVRARLLDIDVLARLAGPDGLQCVIVIGRGDRNGVDVFVFEQLAKIGVRCGALLASLLIFLQALVQDILVDIAERCDLDVVHLAVLLICSTPRPRMPTQPTRTVSLGLDIRRGAAVATAAELMRKCRRFTRFLLMKRFMNTIYPAASHRQVALCPSAWFVAKNRGEQGGR